MAEDRSNERPLFISPDAMSVGVTPENTVSLRLGKPHPSLGFASDLVFAVEMSPAEALALANSLGNAARAALGAPSPIQ